MRRPPVALLLLLLAALVPGAARAEKPAVARSLIRIPGETRGAGIVFFLPASDDVGAVAVSAAHSFEPELLEQAGEVEFRLARTGERVSLSNRYFSEPGRPFHDPGATLRDDYVIFALDVKPAEMRVLEPAPEAPRLGARVEVLGIPSDGTRDQVAVFGTVAGVSHTRLEVDLDSPADLRGWGGAPVLEGDKVVGMLQAAWPSADTLRVGASPIEGVVAALASPLDGGRGRPFTARSPPGDRPWIAATGRTPTSPPSAQPASDPPERAAGPTRLRMEIEQPPDDSIVGNRAGVFVAGRALALQGEFKRFDVVLVLDTSQSTSTPTGVDVDGDGVIGAPPLGPLGALFGGSTDPGDSILAAEVAAAQRLLRGLDPRNTRVAIVVFAGEPAAARRGFMIGSGSTIAPALTIEPLTSDFERVDHALVRVRERGPRGMTHMAAGVDQATVELLGLQGSLSETDRSSEKIVLFFTDGAPTLPYQGFDADNIRAVLRAAQRARRAGIRIHSFAIGPEALIGPVAPVEMANITDGKFTPVRHPGGLVSVIEGVSFANIDEVRVRNLTLDQEAHDVRSHADGSFDALVPLETGKNRIEVTAVASDGAEATDTVTVNYAPGSADPYLPEELVMKRNELLEARLVELRRGRLEAERVKAEETRRELALEIERERAEAAARADDQRKELDLELDPE